MKETLHDSSNTDESGQLISSRFIQIILDEKGILIQCVDAGKTVQDFYGDFDVEFYIFIGTNELVSLKNVLEIREEESDEKLFGNLKDKYSGEHSFTQWKKFLTDNHIKFEFSSF